MAVTKPNDTALNCASGVTHVAVAKFSDIAFTALAGKITAMTVSAVNVAKWVIQDVGKEATFNEEQGQAAGDWQGEGLVVVPNTEDETIAFLSANSKECGWVVIYYYRSGRAVVQGVTINPATPTVVEQSFIPVRFRNGINYGTRGAELSAKVSIRPVGESAYPSPQTSVAFADLGS